MISKLAALSVQHSVSLKYLSSHRPARNKHAINPDYYPLGNLLILDEKMLRYYTPYKDMEVWKDGML